MVSGKSDSSKNVLWTAMVSSMILMGFLKSWISMPVLMKSEMPLEVLRAGTFLWTEPL